GGIELLPNPARHLMIASRYDEMNTKGVPLNSRTMRINSIAFADGHVKALKVEATKSMIWDPAQK
ncbi:MAG: hypothetical protein ACYC0V_12380, partial [Armatimonadota bacterium]